MKCNECAKTLSRPKRVTTGLCLSCFNKRRNGVTGSKHPAWKGDNISYRALHRWVKWNLPKPSECVECGQVPPKDLANISQVYKRDLTDWEWLCRRCHMTKDGRIHSVAKKRYGGHPGLVKVRKENRRLAR